MEHQAIIAAPAAEAVPTILVARHALLGALAMLKRDVVERRNTIPILSGVLFRPLNDGEGVAIVGTDLDIVATVHIPAIFTDGRPFVAASCAALHDAVKASKADEITLELIDGKLRLSGGGSSSTLGTMPADEFPTMVAGDMAAAFTLPGAALAYDLARVSPAISTEETRYYLNGIFLHTGRDQPAARTAEHEAADSELKELELAQYQHEKAQAEGGEGQDDPETAEARGARIEELKATIAAAEAERSAPDVLRFAATDGHRLCVATRPLPDGAATAPAGIIPRKVCALMAKLVGKPKAKGDYQDAHVQLSASKIAFRVGDAFVLAKLIDGSFPDYTRVIPSQNDRVLALIGDELADATETDVWITELELELPAPMEPAGAVAALIEAADEAAAMLDNAIGGAIYDGNEPADAPERVAVDAVAAAIQRVRASSPTAGCDDPTLMRPPIRVAVGLQGGVVQWTLADGPGAVVHVVDFDVEGHDDFDLTLVTDAGGDESPANVYVDEPEIDPLYFARLDTAPTHINGTGAAYGDDDEDQEPNPRHWLVSAEIGVPGEGGGIDAYSGYIPGDTEEEARQLAYALIERRYGLGTRVFSIRTHRPAQEAS